MFTLSDERKALDDLEDAQRKLSKAVLNVPVQYDLQYRLLQQCNSMLQSAIHMYRVEVIAQEKNK